MLMYMVNILKIGSPTDFKLQGCDPTNVETEASCEKDIKISRFIDGKNCQQRKGWLMVILLFIYTWIKQYAWQYNPDNIT